VSNTSLTGFILQDVRRSDCTDTIDGLDGSSGSYSPARSFRKVLTKKKKKHKTFYSLLLFFYLHLTSINSALNQKSP